MKHLKPHQFDKTKRGTMPALSVVLITTLAFFTAAAADARTVHVPRPTGIPSVDWHNIQGTVDSAGAGDTVRFQRGVYRLGDDSEFIVVKAPGVHLKGHRRGTTIVGGPVLPTVGEIGSPYLMGFNSLLQSPPRGFRLTADAQHISYITFKKFRTAVMIGFGEFANTGGYVVEHCKFVRTMYGIQGHVESGNVTAIRGNAFINNTFPFDISGGKYHVSFNFQATPDTSKVPIDNFTHHSGDIAAGGPFYEEGSAFVTENNVFEYNFIFRAAEGFQVIGDFGGVVRNNVFRHNAFFDMQECPDFEFGPCLSGLTVWLSFGGDIVDNVWVENTLVGSRGIPIAAIHLGGLTDGNVIVSNKLLAVDNVTGILPKWGSALEGSTNGIFMDNVFKGKNPGALDAGAAFIGGGSNQFLLNVTDAALAALFIESPDGLFASSNPADFAVDEFDNPITSLDPNQDFTQLLSCKQFLIGTKYKKHPWLGKRHHSDAVSVEEFRTCVDEAVEALH